MSLVLRHQPELIGLNLDLGGWAEIDNLIALSKGHHPLTRDLIEEVVASNNKQRFAISDDGLRIRAQQGHSIDVELGLTPLPPPEWLFHGTATRFLDSIRRKGLNKRSRQHVHLCTEEETATNVGSRHGAPTVLHIRADAMAAAGFAFYRSENGVWLTDAVPVEFIVFEGD